MPDVVKGLRRVAIVGSGPAGMYATKYLRKLGPNVQLDIFEKRAEPYGLLRYGVAPDHVELKSVMREFDRLFECDYNTRLFCNADVTLGHTEPSTQGLSLAGLMCAYDAVVLAVGSGPSVVPFDPNLLPIRNVISGLEFAALCNTGNELDEKLAKIHVERAVVIGIGNVSLDAIRLIHKSNSSPGIIRETVEAIMKTVQRIDVMIRNPRADQAACTPKELREVLNLYEHSTEQSGMVIADHGDKLTRRQTRIQELFSRVPSTAVVASLSPRLHMHFGKTVSGLCKSGDNVLTAVRTASRDGSDRHEMDAQLLVYCAGQSVIPLDHVHNRRVFRVGWCSERGSLGTLADCIMDAQALLSNLRQLDLDAK